MFRSFLIACQVFAICSTLPAAAAEQVLTIDPAATKVAFTLGGTLHTVHGSLPVSRGEIAFDLEAGTASGLVVLEALGAQTGNAKRDKKMHSEVLESEKHPQIVFTAKSIEGGFDDQGSGRITLHGEISIHGGTHPVALEADVEKDGSSLSGTCVFAIPFVQWGMEDPSVFVLRTDKHVDVTLEVRGTLAAQQPVSEETE